MIAVIIYCIVAYNCLNTLQRKAGVFYFGSIGQYFLIKILFSMFFGWVIIPVWLIMALFGKLR